MVCVGDEILAPPARVVASPFATNTAYRQRCFAFAALVLSSLQCCYNSWLFRVVRFGNVRRPICYPLDVRCECLFTLSFLMHSTQSKPKLRWWQFSLRQVFVVFALVCIYFACWEITKQLGVRGVANLSIPYESSPAPLIIVSTEPGASSLHHSFTTNTYYIWLFGPRIRIGTTNKFHRTPDNSAAN